jgi:hypothetical protein
VGEEEVGSMKFFPTSLGSRRRSFREVGFQIERGELVSCM